MKKLLTIIEQAKAGADIDPDDRRYVRSWVAGHNWEGVCNDLTKDLAVYFIPEVYQGMELQNL